MSNSTIDQDTLAVTRPNNVLQSIDQLTSYMPRQEVEYEVNISLKNKYIYVETPKCACSTIKKTLINLELQNTGFSTKDEHPSVLESPFVKLYQLSDNYATNLFNSSEMIKFCFVRNPYARVLSSYLDKIVESNNLRFRTKILALLDKEDIDDQKRSIEFSEFVEVICSQKSYDMDPHWRVLSSHLFGGKIQYDFIGKVENFERDFAKVDSLMGGILRKHYEKIQWHATNAAAKIAKYYDAGIADRVSKKFAEDFERFEYNRELQSYL